ncbi:MAG: hypothetical protein AB7F75_09795 [Planctomycetota bacterium]
MSQTLSPCLSTAMLALIGECRAIDARGAFDESDAKKLLGGFCSDETLRSCILAADPTPTTPYHRRVFWEQPGGWSLVGLAWKPGASTHIHDHNRIGFARTLSGQVDSILFRWEGDCVECLGRVSLSDGKVHTIPKGSSYLHAVAAAGDEISVDLHFYGPATAGDLPYRYDPVESSTRITALPKGSVTRIIRRVDPAQC